MREKNNLNQWLKFFLLGVIETAKDGIKTFDSILQLQKSIDNKIQTLESRVNNAQKVIHYLYERPAIDTTKVAEITGLSLTSAYKLKSDLERLGIIAESSEGIKGKYYIFKEYLELCR